MQNKFFLILFIIGFLPLFSFTQNENTETKDGVIVDENMVFQDTIARAPIDPLRPAKAAFYSAVLPGLGQAYNKKYWKIPIIYAALGTGIYFYMDNNKEYKRYRNAFKRRSAGFFDDEFYFDSQGEPLETPRISTERLQDAQKFFRRNKELSLLVTLGFYALNIIDANVDAHLLQYNVDENLSLAPHYEFNQFDASSNLGLTLNFKF